MIFFSTTLLPLSLANSRFHDIIYATLDQWAIIFDEIFGSNIHEPIYLLRLSTKNDLVKSINYNYCLAMKKLIIASAVVLGGVAFAAFSSNTGDKVDICHKDHHTINVSVNAISAHMAHGDVMGVCGGVTPPTFDPM